MFSFALESLGFERRLYRDFDHDGFGEREDPIASSWCAPPVGYSLVASDCDDRDPTAYPGAAELCDGTNNDCDGRGDDTEPGLCAGDPLGGRCISVDGGASCGCRASADCAPAHECIGGRCVASGAADDASALAEAGFGGAPGSSDAGSGSDAAPAPADGGSRGGSGGQTTAPSPPSNDAPSGGAGPRDAANDGLGPRAEPHEPSCACYAGSAPRSAAPASLLAFLLGGGLLVARRRRRSPSVAR
ncbi:MAG: putative metal-binding motif-containing protein [Deltaproteobacteria bacterium]|nr:putative metal-binding motif-containing protein [Deltaproteobacteria bacterium]